MSIFLLPASGISLMKSTCRGRIVPVPINIKLARETAAGGYRRDYSRVDQDLPEESSFLEQLAGLDAGCEWQDVVDHRRELAILYELQQSK